MQTPPPPHIALSLANEALSPATAPLTPSAAAPSSHLTHALTDYNKALQLYQARKQDYAATLAHLRSL